MRRHLMMELLWIVLDISNFALKPNDDRKIVALNKIHSELLFN